MDVQGKVPRMAEVTPKSQENLFLGGPNLALESLESAKDREIAHCLSQSSFSMSSDYSYHYIYCNMSYP